MSKNRETARRAEYTDYMKSRVSVYRRKEMKAGEIADKLNRLGCYDLKGSPWTQQTINSFIGYHIKRNKWKE